MSQLDQLVSIRSAYHLKLFPFTFVSFVCGCFPHCIFSTLGPGDGSSSMVARCLARGANQWLCQCVGDRREFGNGMLLTILVETSVSGNE
mmetsp:Transcript_5076/g.10310  ORF Transcript_5076/g.10310 Transcript_5076/m.10310 type:complete len:90 (+) Transcript_5076:3569-3838(+)